MPPYPVICCPLCVQVFSKDEGGMPRTWGPRANIHSANQKAQLAAAQLLAQLAVLRLDTAKVPPFTRPPVITSSTGTQLAISGIVCRKLISYLVEP